MQAIDRIRGGLGAPLLLWSLLQAGGVAIASAPAPVIDLPDGIELRQAGMHLRVQALADDLLRVRVTGGAEFPEDASWVVPTALRAQHLAVRPDAAAGTHGFATAKLLVRLEIEPVRLTVSDLAGHVLVADAPTGGYTRDGAGFEQRLQMPDWEHYFGLGDKTGPLDRRGGAFVNWNTDAFGFQESTDPVYKSVPFFLAAGGPAGSYGIYLDNTWRSWFDFGHRREGELAFGANAGPDDYYIIYGPLPRQVVQRYTDLTGRAPLPPLWSLGFQQSRYSYMSADEVRSIGARLRSEHIPADVIWMDIDYQDHYRPFTVNRESFPDLPALVAGMRREGFHLVPITDLHVAALPAAGYAPYELGMKQDAFVHRADGSLYVAEVWPGPAVFPDFTAAPARAYWGRLYRDFVADGFAGFWNDMNEPAIFNVASKTMPLDNRHRIDEPGFAPRVATHAEVHNIYGMENTRATFEGLRALAPDERPYVMTRASFAGGQRYAVTWTGDNSASWNHLRLSIAQLQNLSLSGFAWSGADVGGFAGAPPPEVMTRWIQVATFTPVFRAHSAKGEIRKEPWENGPQHTAIRRHFIEERYRLLPYLYALADENARTGAPVMRPVFYEYPDALSPACGDGNEFLLGRSILVEPGQTLERSVPYDVCLPAGGWYDYWTGEPVQSDRRALPGFRNTAAGGMIITATPDLASLPVFVRAGTILPRQPLVQHTGESPQGPLTLEVYPGDDCSGALYLDDGHSMEFERGGYLRQSFTCRTDADGLTLAFGAREGRYPPWWHAIEVRVHGWSGMASASIGGRGVLPHVDAGMQAVTVVIDDQVGAAELRISRAAARH
jgi:alpha-glucosidase